MVTREPPAPLSEPKSNAGQLARQRGRLWARRLLVSPGIYALAAGLPALLAVNSPRAAPEWFFFLFVVFSLAALLLAVAGTTGLALTLKRYRAESIHFDAGARGLSRSAGAIFRAGQVGAVALAIGLAAVIALALPGLAVLAALLTPPLAVALAALPGGMSTSRPADSALSLVVPARLLQLGSEPDERFRTAWRFTARMCAVRAAIADRAAPVPSEARDIAKALDGGGMIRPPVGRLHFDTLGLLRLRVHGLAAVGSASLPVALAVWLVAALSPVGAFPALPRPSDILLLVMPDSPTIPDAATDPHSASPSQGEEDRGFGGDADNMGTDRPDRAGAGSGLGDGQGNTGSDSGSGQDTGSASGGTPHGVDRQGAGAEYGEDSEAGSGAGQDGGSTTEGGSQGGGDSEAEGGGSQGAGSASGSGDGSQGADGQGGGSQAGEAGEGGTQDGGDASEGRSQFVLDSGADAGGTQDGERSSGGAAPGGADAGGSQVGGSAPGEGSQGMDGQGDGSQAGQTDEAGASNARNAAADGPQRADGQGGASPGRAVAGSMSDATSSDGTGVGSADPSGGTVDEPVVGAETSRAETLPASTAAGVEPSRESPSGTEVGPVLTNGSGVGANERGNLPSGPAEDEGETVVVGTPPSLFAEPGAAPPAVLRDLSSVTSDDGPPPGPAIPPRQRLPAWIADLFP